MATTKTAAQIYARAREKADQDQPGTGPRFVDDDEARSEVSDSLARLWDVLVEHGGDELLRTSQAVTVSAGVADIDPPSDVYKLLSIDLYTPDGEPPALGDWVRELERVEWVRRNDWRDQTGEPVGYALHAFADALSNPQKIRLFPTPSAAYSALIWYIPEAPTLAADTDTVTLPNAWWQWVIVDVAVQLMSKAEEDASALRDERERLTRTIAMSARRQDHGSPRRVQLRRRRWLEVRVWRDRVTLDEGW